MIERVLLFSIRQRALVIILSLIFVVLGLVAASRVPIDAVPDVTNVQVQVITPAPALSPIDVETYVTTPVERSMAGLPNVSEIRSISRAGISVVTIVFEDEMRLHEARHLVDSRLTEARQAIPNGYGEPQLGPMSSGLSEVFHFEVRGSSNHSLMQLRSTLDWQIAPRLKMVPGVTEVNVFGGEARTLEIELNPQRMTEARIGVKEVVEAIERNHLAVGGAYIVNGRENITIRGEARIHSREDLEHVVIERRGERTPIFLRDVGEVRYAPRVRYGAVTRDGRGEAVVGVVMMLVGQNSGKVAEQVREAIRDISKSLPEGVHIDPYYDRTELVRRTIHTVRTNLLEASALVIAILFMTLVSLRAGSIVALAIPLALLGVFIGMWFFGISGNLLSLGAIDFGLVVDGAIIIIENAQRHLAEQRIQLGRPLTNEERKHTVFEAAREVRSATAFGELIIALVYIPLFALEGVEGRMFRPMAMAVLFALASAFVLSLTLVPALASLVLSRNTQDKQSFLIRFALRLYRPALKRVMAVPVITSIVAILVFAISLVLGATMGREFLPKLDEGTIVIPAVRLPSSSLKQSTDQTTHVENILKTFPEVKSVVSRTGRAEIAVDPMGLNMSDVYVLLKPREEWASAHDREGLVAVFDKALTERVPGIGFSYSQPIEMNTNDLLAGISSDVAVHIYGHDLIVLKKTGEQLIRLLREVPGAKDVRGEQVAGLHVLTVRVDRTAAGRNGVDAKTILDAVSALGGIEAGTVIEGNSRYPIQVRFNELARTNQQTIEALPIRTASGTILPLAQLAHVSIEPGPSQISRERLDRRLTVQLNVRGRDLASFVEQARLKIDKELKLPTEYSLAWAGNYERLQSAQQRLLIVIPITMALILVLLIATFGRTKPALIIFLNVPIALSGGIASLYVRHMPLSISAAVGFIALFGVAVLNGLVLISSIERLQRSGLSIANAVLEGAEGRLRPVLTTALVASLGFLPMALATGAGAEVQRPLATVVIGGILSSTLLTLLALPSVYAWASTLKRKT